MVNIINYRIRLMETLIKSGKIIVERKQFFFDLKENPRGRFLKITEETGGCRSTVIIPSTGLREFVTQVVQMDDRGENL